MFAELDMISVTSYMYLEKNDLLCYIGQFLCSRMTKYDLLLRTGADYLIMTHKWYICVFSHSTDVHEICINADADGLVSPDLCDGGWPQEVLVDHSQSPCPNRCVLYMTYNKHSLQNATNHLPYNINLYSGETKLL